MSRYPTLLNSNTFIQLPTDSSLVDEEISIENIYRLISENALTKNTLTYFKIASVIRRLLLSLKGATLSLQEILKLWEIRIISMIFATGHRLDLGQAQIFKIQSTKFIKNEVDILIPELYKINKLRKQHDLSFNLKQRLVEQFPVEVSSDFKFLLLKIRYGSSLMLVNEYYNHMWRLQDRTFIESSKISFSIIAVLTARQEYLTLINLINSVLIHLSPNDTKDDSLINYYNRLVLIKTIAHLIRVEKERLTVSDKEIKLEFEMITNSQPMKNLNKVLNLVAPIYSDPESSPVKDESIYNENMEENYKVLEKQVVNFDITGRILCTFCAFCEIQIEKEDNNNNNNNNSNGTGSTDDDNDVEPVIHESILKGLNTIKQGWVDNATKYYGLE